MVGGDILTGQAITGNPKDVASKFSQINKVFGDVKGATLGGGSYVAGLTKIGLEQVVEDAVLEEANGDAERPTHGTGVTLAKIFWVLAGLAKDLVQ